MIKRKGNITKAKEEILKIENAISYVYNSPKFTEGVLSGATVLIKDNYATKDAPTQASSKIMENFTPKYDATVVKKLKENGAALIAKTHLDELALGGNGLLSAYGQISNPLDNRRLSGGSSSGAAATFNKNISISIGSDTGDSVRLPASYIGKVGFKPSYGAISRYGLFAFATSLDTVAYFAHNVNDIIATSQVLYGKDNKDFSSVEVEKPIFKKAKPKKVIVLDFIGMPDYAKQEIEKFETKLVENNIEVIHKSLPEDLQHLIDITYSVISFAESSSNGANLTGITFGERQEGKDWKEVITNTRSKKLGKMVQRRYALGSFFLLIENQKDIFHQAQKVRRIITDKIREFINEGDIIINPANTIAPFIKDGKEDTPFVNNLAISNFSGMPNIVIPFGKHDNMPFGLSIMGKLYKDKELLSYSLYIEELSGGSNE